MTLSLFWFSFLNAELAENEPETTEDDNEEVVLVDESNATVADELFGDVESEDLQGFIVWGVAIALLSTAESSSGSGTATTN